MRQLTCTGLQEVEWRDVPEPQLGGDGEALIRPLAVARCEIDPFLIAGFIPSPAPFALGHEAVAEIVSLGDSVRGLQIGQRVVVSFQVSCGRCASCGAGISGNCDAYPVLSDYGMMPLSGYVEDHGAAPTQERRAEGARPEDQGPHGGLSRREPGGCLPPERINTARNAYGNAAAAVVQPGIRALAARTC